MVRASADGQKLEVKSIDEQHNHKVNRELFRNLYHQRKLDDAEKKKHKTDVGHENQQEDYLVQPNAVNRKTIANEGYP